MGQKTFRDVEVDKPDQARKRCKFWSFGGRCSQADAPKPSTSRCIGTRACNYWEWKPYH